MGHDVLQQHVDYYRARAGEYDEWFLRQGRYDRGPELNARWFSEVETVVAALDTVDPRGDVLELACGTGLWTQRLAPYANQLTAVDAAPEVLATNAIACTRPTGATSRRTCSPGNRRPLPSMSSSSASGCRTCRRIASNGS